MRKNVIFWSIDWPIFAEILFWEVWGRARIRPMGGSGKFGRCLAMILDKGHGFERLGESSLSRSGKIGNHYAGHR